MQLNDLLISIAELSEVQSSWIDFGLISCIENGSERYVMKDQLARLDRLTRIATELNYKNPHPSTLFQTDHEIYLGHGTVIVYCGLTTDAKATDNILWQLLPVWIEAYDESIDSLSNTWDQVFVNNIEIWSRNVKLIARIKDALSATVKALDSRSVQFARSASYMGSKANLAPYFVEILKDSISEKHFILDLMCGSGAASGVFCNYWRTIASDAQMFSKMLATVQGGGMSSNRAREISDEVIMKARNFFNDLPEFLKKHIEIESEFLSSELSNDMLNEFSVWVSSYPRVNNQGVVINRELEDLLEKAKADRNNHFPILFSAYYANLFFGVRQAAEIDCIRAAIETLNDETKAWALGALICAISSRAYTYGGHFAQPKLDSSNLDKIKKLAPEIVVSFGQSVSHEFFVRLSNLGNESENVKFPVEQIDGPWEIALSKLLLTHKNDVCVYLDPPYTRDEYSRYYHVLETLVRYDYPEIRDKPSIPKRGHAGRFASEFFTRNTQQVENLIISIIEKCLANNWSCMWSYSDSGIASIKNIIDRIQSADVKIDLYSTAYAYNAQGKGGKKNVKEYAIFIQKFAN